MPRSFLRGSLRRLLGRPSPPGSGGPAPTAESTAHEAHEVAAHERRFAAGPVGRWSGAVGTFGAVTDARWEFRPDGTGSRAPAGLRGAEPDEPFEWRPVAAGTIALRWRTEDEEEGGDGWFAVRYGFRLIRHDLGAEVALVDLAGPGEGWLGEGWLGEAPLAYRGASPRVEPAADEDQAR